MTEVKFIVLADTAEFTLTDIDPLNSLLVKRKSDGLLYVQRAAASRHTHCSISCVCLEGGGSDAAAAGTP